MDRLISGQITASAGWKFIRRAAYEEESAMTLKRIMAIDKIQTETEKDVLPDIEKIPKVLKKI